MRMMVKCGTYYNLNDSFSLISNDIKSKDKVKDKDKDKASANYGSSAKVRGLA